MKWKPGHVTDLAAAYDRMRSCATIRARSASEGSAAAARTGTRPSLALRARIAHRIDARGHSATRRRWLALLLIGLGAPPLLAQAAVRLEVAHREVYVNEPFTVTVRVSDFQECDPPKLPSITDCTVTELEGGSDSSYTSIINGRRTASRSRTYVFELTAEAVGELVIPPFSVNVDGRTLQTDPARLTVKASDANELLAVEIACDRQRVYVGQRVRLTMTIWVKPQPIQGQRLGIRDMLRFIRPINFGPFPIDNVNTGSQRLANPDGTTETYFTYQTWTDYVPDRPGRLSFDDIVVGMQYPMSMSRDLFGGWQVQSVRNLRARPRVADVEILPLPDNGRPPNFTGAVGTFELIVTASPTSVRVGDPIKLQIDIRGDGLIETLPPPNLAADPRLTQSFRVPDEELPGEASGSRKRFTATIRAVHAGVEEIPPIEYAYFDPDREMYVVALSDAIPLSVVPAAELDAAALAEISGVTAEPNAPQLRALDGLRANETRESQLLCSATPVGLLTLAAVTFAPAAVFLLAWGSALVSQSRTPGRRRRQSALRTARRRLEHARRLPPTAAAAEVATAFAGYLADRLDQPAARFTGRAAIDFLHTQNLADETVAGCRQLVDRCEQASFGGLTDGDSATLADEAHDCLRALERERL